MGKKLENAKNLYLEGIRKGELKAVDMYTGDRYTQHSTGVRDGVEGFKEFFEDFLKRTDDRNIQIIRAIEDGNYVFVHAYQDIDYGKAKWVTTDMFDTDTNDKIVEHWDVITAYKEPSETVSGNDVILGDFEIKDLEKTEENKALIRSYFVDVFQNGNHDALAKYVSKDSYIQHNPYLENGYDAFRTMLDKIDFQYDYVFHVMGQGNYVVAMSKATYEGEAYCIFDIFRVEDGKIVEQWDNMEPIPPRSEWANTGKF